MATITAVELRERVARHLRVQARDLPLDAGVAADIDQANTDARAELIEQGLCWWSADAIPQAAAFALTLIGAAQAAAKVGKLGQGYEQGDSEGRRRLAQIKPSADIGTVAADYY